MTTKAAGTLDDDGSIIDVPYKDEMSRAEQRAAGTVFHMVERLLLVLVMVMTLIAVVGELLTMWNNRAVTLGDLLLMFLYTEVVGMIAVFYTGRASTFVYPIFIAITALARLILLQGKEMKPENILYQASAILLLTIAAVVIVRVGKS